jgi:hypothetical protein
VALIGSSALAINPEKKVAAISNRKTIVAGR